MIIQEAGWSVYVRFVDGTGDKLEYLGVTANQQTFATKAMAADAAEQIKKDKRVLDAWPVWSMTII